MYHMLETTLMKLIMLYRIPSIEVGKIYTFIRELTSHGLPRDT